MGNKIMRILLVVMTVVAILYGLLLVLMYQYQETIIFPGVPLAAEHSFQSDTAIDVNFSEVIIPVEGGQLSAIHFTQEDPKGLVFFLHGNGGNIQTWATGADYYQQVNYDMFMIDYRGYGKSTGSIESQQQLHRDVLTAWNTIAPHYQANEQQPRKPIIIYGRSLGTALSVKLATEVEADGLVLVSAFSSLSNMAKKEFPWAPSALLRYPLPTDSLISRVKSPVMLIHGSEDELVPVSHSRALYERLQSPSVLIEIDGAGHGDIHHYPEYINPLTRFLESIAE